MKTVLVTGASGFVGRHTLAPLLAKGFHVIGVSRHPLWEITDVQWQAIDLLDLEAGLKLIEALQPEYLLHCAWYALPGKFWDAPENLDWLYASQNLIAAFAENGGERLLGIGSCAEYDWNLVDQVPWKETDLCNPHSLYGQTKLALLRWLEQQAYPRLRFAWARLFYLFGPYEPAEKLVSAICLALLRNQPVQCTSGEQIRDFLDIRVVGQLLADMLDSPLEGPVNAASGEPISIAAVAREIANCANQSHLLHLGSLPSRPHDPPYIVADTAKLNSHIHNRFNEPVASQLIAFYQYLESSG